MSTERLADGWGADESEHDTLLRAGVLSLASRIRHHAASLDREVDETSDWVAAALAERGMFSNAGLVIRPPTDWDWVPGALARLAPAGVPRLLMSPFPTSDLSVHGCQLIGHPPFMLRPAGDGGPGPADGLEIREVTTAADAAAFERTLVRAYPIPDMDPERPSLFTESYLGGASRLFLGLVDGEPVATAAAHVACGVNHVEFVATAAEHRGRGLGAAVTWAATVADPTLPAVLISSDDGRGVYESLGYLPIVRWTLWLAP